MKRLMLALAASAAAMTVAPAANAAIVFGYSVNGGAITTLTPMTSGSTSTFIGSASNYTISLTATGPTGTPDLQTLALSVANSANSAAGTINLWVTKTDINPFTGGLLSTFNSNTLTGAANQATITSYFSASNATFAGTVLQTNTFNGLGTFAGSNAITAGGGGLRSETIRYDIRFGGGEGTFNGTANLAAVPEPATWAMMMLGFGAMGAMIRRRKTTTSARIRFA